MQENGRHTHKIRVNSFLTYWKKNEMKKKNKNIKFVQGFSYIQGIFFKEFIIY